MNMLNLKEVSGGIGFMVEFFKQRGIPCELCQYDWEDNENPTDKDSIKSTGRCVNCYEEYGDNYPDRV